MAWKALKSPGCVRCGFCETRVDCPAGQFGCIGCGNCVKGCPTGARQVVAVESTRGEIELRIDGDLCRIPAGGTVGHALQQVGKGHGRGRECGTGGCWDCGVLVGGELRRACATPAVAGMELVTSPEALRGATPLRLVSFFPNHFHASVSVFTHGCNFACDFCHNWDLAFSSAGRALTPKEAAEITQRLAGPAGNRRTGISGGEPTLNRRWLVEYIGNLKALSPDVRIQVDTNASFLTPDYVDELWEAGMTDLSPDLKGLEVATFQRITGVEDAVLAAGHLERAWGGVEYALSRYRGRLNIAVAIPFHPSLIGLDEVRRMGVRLAAMEPGLDVNLIVYQPAFRMRHGPRVPDAAIDEAVEALEDTGVTVWCQEGDDIPAAALPEQFASGSDEVF